MQKMLYTVEQIRNKKIDKNTYIKNTEVGVFYIEKKYVLCLLQMLFNLTNNRLSHTIIDIAF